MSGPFRKYDIRGIYPDEIGDDLAYEVGRAVASYFEGMTIAVGHDQRVGSPSLHSSLVKGIIEQGSDVVDIGFCTTPQLYHYNTKRGIPGLMVTASHNPPEYNGIKINSYDGRMLAYGSGLEEIERIIDNESYDDPETQGSVTKSDALSDYSAFLRKKLGVLKRKLKVVIDASNGASGHVLEKVFYNIDNVEVVPLFFEPRGSDPGHSLDPTKDESLVEISQKVRDTGADLGAILDGDGDRCIILDERGAPISSDILFCMIVENEMDVDAGDPIFYSDVWASRIVKRVVEDVGGTHKILPIGIAGFKEKMIMEGGIAGAETSGHIVYKDNLSQDDGVYTLAKVMRYLSSSDKTISGMVAPYMIYFGDKENIRVKDSERLLDLIRDEFSGASFEEVDGLTVSYDDWWFNVRESNTEPLVRVRIEADSPDKLKEKRLKLLNFIYDNA